MKWFIPFHILLASFLLNYAFALNKWVISSDSVLEYNTFITYTEQGHWSRLTDNLLSGCLWTTYLPSIINGWFNIANPELTYRITLTIIISFLPPVIYLVLRKYTSIWVSIGLTIIFMTSVYYQGSTEYARMNIAMVMSVLLLMGILSKNRFAFVWIILSTIGLITAHYTTAFIYLGAIGIAGLFVIAKHLISRQRAEFEYKLLVGFSSLFILAIAYYSFIGSPIHYSLTVIGGIQRDIPIMPGVVYYTFSHLNAAGLFLIIRITLCLAIFASFFQQNKLNSLIPWLALAIAEINMTVIFPSIQRYIGALRPSYVLLPIELLVIASWWGTKRMDLKIAPAIIVWASLYH